MPKESNYSLVYTTPYGVASPMEARRILSESQNHRCCYCGVEMTDPEIRPPLPTACTIEHIMSRSRGGADVWENIVAACTRCNSWRSSDILPDGREIAAIAWFYKRQGGHDVRPLGQRKVTAPKVAAGKVHAPQFGYGKPARIPRPTEQARREAASIAAAAIRASKPTRIYKEGEASRATVPLTAPRGKPGDCNFDPAQRPVYSPLPPPKRMEPIPREKMSKRHRRQVEIAAQAQAPMMTA